MHSPVIFSNRKRFLGHIPKESAKDSRLYDTLLLERHLQFSESHGPTIWIWCRTSYDECRIYVSAWTALFPKNCQCPVYYASLTTVAQGWHDWSLKNLEGKFSKNHLVNLLQLHIPLDFWHHADSYYFLLASSVMLVVSQFDPIWYSKSKKIELWSIEGARCSRGIFTRSTRIDIPRNKITVLHK